MENLKTSPHTLKNMHAFALNVSTKAVINDYLDIHVVDELLFFNR